MTTFTTERTDALQRQAAPFLVPGFRPSTAFISTYPPTQCGLATYSAALLRATARNRRAAEGLGVIRLVDDKAEPSRLPEVTCEHRVGTPSALLETLEHLRRFDVVNIQHEYGIFGPNDGDEAVRLLEALGIPAIVTLHSVLQRPSSHQRAILEEIVELADRVVVMTVAARDRLLAGYRVDPTRVRVIPHGASEGLARPTLSVGKRPVVLTWGLLGPGKGIEWAIDAVALLRGLDPNPYYRVLGETHPKVRAAQGEAYRECLRARANALGVTELVSFEGGYRDLDSLERCVRAADLILLPYESTDQVTSGVLVEALAAGKPVVATAFPHAVEALASGAGLVVPHADPRNMARAIRRVLTEPGLAGRMATEARRIAPSLFWSATAERYEDLAIELVPAPAAEQRSLAVVTSSGPIIGLAEFGDKAGKYAV